MLNNVKEDLVENLKNSGRFLLLITMEFPIIITFLFSLLIIIISKGSVFSEKFALVLFYLLPVLAISQVLYSMFYKKLREHMFNKIYTHEYHRGYTVYDGDYDMIEIIKKYKKIR